MKRILIIFISTVAIVISLFLGYGSGVCHGAHFETKQDLEITLQRHQDELENTQAEIWQNEQDFKFVINKEAFLAFIKKTTGREESNEENEKKYINCMTEILTKKVKLSNWAVKIQGEIYKIEDKIREIQFKKM